MHLQRQDRICWTRSFSQGFAHFQSWRGERKGESDLPFCYSNFYYTQHDPTRCWGSEEGANPGRGWRIHYRMHKRIEADRFWGINYSGQRRPISRPLQKGVSSQKHAEPTSQWYKQRLEGVLDQIIRKRGEKSRVEIKKSEIFTKGFKLTCKKKTEEKVQFDSWWVHWGSVGEKNI